MGRNYGLTCLITILRERLTFLLTFSYVQCCWRLAAADASFVAWLLASYRSKQKHIQIEGSPHPCGFPPTFGLRFTYINLMLKMDRWEAH